MMFSRRQFVSAAAAVAAHASLSARMKQAAATCPFRLSVINDEISPDFDHACYVAAHDFGLSWIEIRNIGGKTLTSLTTDQIADAKKSLAKYNLKVTDLASPLFKTDLPGAPESKAREGRDKFNADFSYKAQDDLRDHLIELAKTFGTDRIRCFDFWRLENPAAFRAEINHKLQETAEICDKHGLILLLENEQACNTATGVEAAAVIHAIPNKNFMLNWDAANSASFAGDVAYPADYALLPKNRIGHVHCKNVRRTPDGPKKFEWEPVDIGEVDWVNQFKALQRDGYHYAVSLETHWRGGTGTTPSEIAESSSRISMKGLKKCLQAAGITCP